MSSGLVFLTRNKTALLLSTFMAICAVSLGQTNAQNVPQPPSAELQKFEPFLGKYKVSGDYANLPWAGTLELNKVIKGWYIEQIIRIKSPGIDREFWVLATWDKNAQKYRLWGFQTLPSQIEGDVRFEDDEMITVFTYPVADGQKATSTNRYKFVGNNELLVTSYRQVGNGPVEKIGTLTGKRIARPAPAVSSSKEDDDKSVSPREPQPASQLQSLESAFEGRWSIREQFEPDEWTPKGGTGSGEEVWRRGPGGFTFMEEVHMTGPDGDSYGLAISWWDKSKGGFDGMWCVSSNPKTCNANSRGMLAWDGKQQIVENEFPRNGKTFVWREVFSDITPTSFVQTADIGEKGGPMKRWLTIHATKVADEGQNEIEPTSTNHETKVKEGSTESSNIPAEEELRAFMAKLRRASIDGDVETAANSMTDDYLQTDINGYRQDKTTWLNEYFRPLAALIKAGKFHWDEYERKNLQFRFYGDCAVVIGELHAKGTGAKLGPQHTWVADPNGSFSGTLHFTHVYIKQNGKWMLAALHNQMPLPPANVAN